MMLLNQARSPTTSDSHTKPSGMTEDGVRLHKNFFVISDLYIDLLIYIPPSKPWGLPQVVRNTIVGGKKQDSIVHAIKFISSAKVCMGGVPKAPPVQL